MDLTFYPPSLQLLQLVAPSARWAGHGSTPFKLPRIAVWPGCRQVFQLVPSASSINVAETLQLLLTVDLSVSLVEYFVPSPFGGFRIEQNRVSDVPVTSGCVMALGSLPRNFVLEIACTIDAVHHQFEVVAGRRVAVQVYRPRVLQNPTHLQQAHCHHAEIRLHPFAVGQAGRLQYLVHRRLLVGDQTHPRHVEVRQRPRVLERRPRRRAPHRRRVVAVRVERRVQVNQVRRLRVQPPQYLEVVPGPDRSFRKVAQIRFPWLGFQRPRCLGRGSATQFGTTRTPHGPAGSPGNSNPPARSPRGRSVAVDPARRRSTSRTAARAIASKLSLAE